MLPKTIQRGDKGDEVKQWQKILGAGTKPTKWSADWQWPLAVDGEFGERCHVATEAYQTANGLKVDGVVGPNTWGKALGTK